jgi:ADP-heptose:LPS heptosyltransferase
MAAARRCPHLDDVLDVPLPSVRAGASTGGAWRSEARRAAARLADAFDAAIIVRPDDPWSGKLVSAAAIPVRVGFDMPRTRPWLTDVLPRPSEQHVALDGFDLADALLDRLGVRARTERVLEPSFVPARQDEEEAERVLAAVGADREAIVLHPGSGWALKNWPIRKWRGLVLELAASFGTTLLVAGTAAEAPLVRAVAAATPALDLAGCLSLGALAAVHRSARLVVTTDSGALHLAAAMDVPVVGLFGPVDPRLFAPLASPRRIRIVRAGLPCSPCGTLEHPPCGAVVAPACMRGIQVPDVVRAAAELLAEASAL